MRYCSESAICSGCRRGGVLNQLFVITVGEINVLNQLFIATVSEMMLSISYLLQLTKRYCSESAIYSDCLRAIVLNQLFLLTDKEVVF